MYHGQIKTMDKTIPEGIVAVLGLAGYHEAGYWKVVIG